MPLRVGASAPCVKFLLSVSARLLFVFMLATLPASTHQSTAWLLFLLVWALTLAIDEALEMRRHGFAFWAADRLNLLSLPPFVCAPVGLAALLLAETARDATAGSLLSDGGRSTSAIVGQDLVAISAALLMLSELLRLFQLSDSLAPLVTALFHMLGDVLQWLLLSSVFLAALAVGLYSRLSGLGAPSAGPLPPPPPRTEFPPTAEDQTRTALRMLKSFKPPETHLSMSSDTCDVAAMAMGESVWATLSLLVSGLFGGETYVDCIDPQRDRVTAFLLSTYVVVGTVLLVNVLIAMLTKSFDSVGARSRQLAHLTFARTVIQCERQPVAPPPLSALSLPYVLLSAAARRLRGGRTRRGYAPLHAPEAELDLDITKLRSAKAGQSGSAWEDTDADDSRLVAATEQFVASQRADLHDALHSIRKELALLASRVPPSPGPPRSKPKAAPAATPQAGKSTGLLATKLADADDYSYVDVYES